MTETADKQFISRLGFVDRSMFHLPFNFAATSLCEFRSPVIAFHFDMQLTQLRNGFVTFRAAHKLATKAERVSSGDAALIHRSLALSKDIPLSEFRDLRRRLLNRKILFSTLSCPANLTHEYFSQKRFMRPLIWKPDITVKDYLVQNTLALKYWSCEYTLVLNNHFNEEELVLVDCTPHPCDELYMLDLLVDIASEVRRFFASDWKPLTLKLKGKIDPSIIAALAHCFECPIETGGGYNAIRMKAACLNLPPNALASSQGFDSELVLDGFDPMHVNDRNLVHQVRVLLNLGTHHSEFSGSSLAKKLGMSQQRLRRRLVQHGTSLDFLVSEAFKKRVSKILLIDQLSIANAAEVLGYSEVSSFSRSLLRLTGMRPSSIGSS